MIIFGLFFFATSAEADWVLVWSDEFDGSTGQSPDASKWGYDIGTDWGNAQLEYDTDRTDNVSLDGNGNLVITAREELYMSQPYTSARVVSRDRYDLTYGKITARMKLPTGQGLWPAFWLLGSNIGSVGWPQCGEIDIMEYRGQEPDVVLGSIHGPGYSGGAALTQNYILPVGQFDTEFHVFTVEWEESEIRWYVDDILYYSVAPENLGANEWVFDHPFYIILNVAVGGNFVGAPDVSTIFPQTMLVDYVRVYQQGGSGGGCCVGIRGNANNDAEDKVNIADVTYLSAYLFELPGGPAPLCTEEGNVNADLEEKINISDITYLVSYLFGVPSGPAPEACPTIVTPAEPVFVDGFESGVTYEAFAGSKLDAIQIDTETKFAGTGGLSITIPDAGYSGGAFTTIFSRDLTPYNALTFWAKASKAATLDIAGIGNDNTGTSIYTAETTDLALTTSWQKYTIPIPLSDKLNSEAGLFFFAEGPEGGSGYKIWMDEIKFENLSTIDNIRPVISSEAIDVEIGQSITLNNGTVTSSVNGTDVVVSAMPSYFTYESSNDAVVSVSGDGTVTPVGTGTATLTATLGSIPAAGNKTLNVSAPPGQPNTPAPTPTVNPADVISLFSDAYSNATVNTWSANWDQADVEDFFVGSDKIKKYTNLVYAGIEFTSPTIDITAMTHFHIDVWTPDVTSAPSVFMVKLVDFGANGVWDGSGDDVEHELVFDENTMNSNEWVGIEIPLSAFINLTTKGHLAQLLISGDPNTVYIDNIYFHK